MPAVVLPHAGLMTHTIGMLSFPGMTQLDLTAPFEVLHRIPGAEVHLLCHDAAAGERWRHFGVVDVAARRVVEKPATPLGSTWCWGAAWWTAAFTDRLAAAPTITDAINEAPWIASCPIERYEDIGLHPGLTVP